MTYTNNVPQGNQQIATTQPLIQANFGFLDTAIGQEHNFDSTDATKTYHLQAAMPNKVTDPVALPTSTNGIYYVKGGVPKFYDGTTASFIQTTTNPQVTLTGTVALSTTVATVAAIPNNSAGNYYILSTASSSVYATGQFTSGASVVQPTDLSGTSPGITVSGSGLNLRARVDSSGDAGTYSYVVVYVTP